jgi:hypothetical protein
MSGKVRAKFKCNKIERSMGTVGAFDADGKLTYQDAEIRTLVLSPVYGNGDPNHENTKFWQASPSGEIRLGCANAVAAESFELGKEYYVDFTPAGE